ncbi:MAG: hypothetical protein R6W87_02525 [Halospina sp.]
MRHGLGAVVICALLVAGWNGVGAFQQREAPREARLHLVLDGTHYRVPQSRLPELQARSGIWFRQGATLGQDGLEARLERGMVRLFEPVEKQVPAFLDWYYSLGGEYTRLSGWALEKLGFEGRAMVVSRTEALLFKETHFQARLAALEHGLAADAGRYAERTRKGWRRMMRAALADYQVPPPLNYSRENDPRALDLDVLSSGVMADERARLENRLALSGAGGIATGALVWRAATRAAVASGGRAAAARGAGRVASRAGSAALAGLGVCGATGPLAIGCGLVAGTAAWISIDWAMIEADEWANRDRLERRLGEGLDDVRQDLKSQLSRALKERLEQLNGRQRARIRNTLTPLETIKKAATQGGGQMEHG